MDRTNDLASSGWTGRRIIVYLAVAVIVGSTAFIVAVTALEREDPPASTASDPVIRCMNRPGTLRNVERMRIDGRVAAAWRATLGGMQHAVVNVSREGTTEEVRARARNSRDVRVGAEPVGRYLVEGPVRAWVRGPSYTPIRHEALTTVRAIARCIRATHALR